MKHIIIIGLFIASCINCFSQDTLFFTSGEQVKAKVLEVKPDVVTYKMYENIDGPTYTVYKHELRTIHFQNGYIETISTTNNTKPVAQTKPTEQSKTQSTADTKTALTCKKGIVKQNNTVLTNEQVRELFKTNQQALDLYNKGKKIEKVDNILATASLIIVGSVAVLQLGGYVGTPAVIGACVYFVGAYTTATVFRTIGRSKIKESVALYNGSIQK